MLDREGLSRAAEAQIGRTFQGKWRVLRLIGSGGMAAVYEAEHRNGKRVAIKVLHSVFSSSENQRRRFLREARAANAICHPGVVEIYDDGVTDEGDTFLVMELLDGKPAGAIARERGGRLDAELVASWADQVLEVLAAAHARGVIHRDLKPDNLFITTDGRVKVLDFGIARLLEETSVDTQAGGLLGTPGFMPHEQARGRFSEVDARTDIWAVGATLFTLLSGERVYEGETPNEELGLAMATPARSLGRVRADLPRSFMRVIDRALEFNQKDRWQDAQAMQAALRKAALSLPAHAARALRPGRRGAILAAVVAVPGLAGGAFLLRSEVSEAHVPVAVVTPAVPIRMDPIRTATVSIAPQGPPAPSEARPAPARLTGSKVRRAMARPATRMPKRVVSDDPLASESRILLDRRR
jgi:eukaryotic-like serine/threonine-protein kinase